MIEIEVRGMTCEDCEQKVTRAIQALDSGAVIHADRDLSRVSVNSEAAASDLVEAVRAAGYEAQVAR